MVVGLCVERSLEMVVGLLGILKAGGAYLPLDPDYPPRAPRLHAGGRARAACWSRSRRCSSVCPRTAPPSCASMPTGRPSRRSPTTAPANGLRPQNPAYVIYTSGSTGTPKGVVDHPPERRAAVRRDRTPVPLRRRRRLDAVPFVRLRLLGLGDLGRAPAWRPLGRGSPFGQPLTTGILAPCCARRRNRPQSDAVGVLSIDADGPGESRPRTNAGATLCDLRRRSAGAQEARPMVPAPRRRRASPCQHVRHHRNDGACQPHHARPAHRCRQLRQSCRPRHLGPSRLRLGRWLAAGAGRGRRRALRRGRRTGARLSRTRPG